MKTTHFLAALVVTASIVATAQAQTAYTDLGSFLGATGGLTLYNFEGIAGAGSFATNPGLSPLTINILNGNDSNFYVYDPAAALGAFSLNGTASLVAGHAGGTLPSVSIGLGGNYTAFGTKIGFRGGAGVVNNGFTAKLYKGGVQVGVASNHPLFGGDFIGFTSNADFDKVELTSHTQDFSYQVYDDVRVGNALAVTPEAPGLVQVLPGLLPLGWVLLRRRNRKAA